MGALVAPKLNDRRVRRAHWRRLTGLRLQDPDIRLDFAQRFNSYLSKLIYRGDLGIESKVSDVLSGPTVITYQRRSRCDDALRPVGGWPTRDRGPAGVWWVVTQLTMLVNTVDAQRECD
jgi:hypothetical protein